MNKPWLDHIVWTLEWLMLPGQVVEMRALEAVGPANKYRPSTISGYFDNCKALAASVAEIDCAKGIYFTPNIVNPELVARAANRARPIFFKQPTTSDADILRRHWLLIDFDPARPSGISSTDAEHEGALRLAYHVAEALTHESWPAPIICDSGNGAHLMYRIDLPPNDSGLVKSCLTALAVRFDTLTVQIDQTCFNPARIWKLPGTWAAKGDSTSTRPHRLAKVVRWPERIYIVDPKLLTALAAQAPMEPRRETFSQPFVPNGSRRFDLEAWITLHKLEVTGPDPWQGGRRWVFRICPWDASHTNLSAFIVQQPSGAIGAGCHHATCAGKNWHDLRDMVEPGWRERHRPSSALALPDAMPAAIKRQFSQKLRTRLK